MKKHVSNSILRGFLYGAILGAGLYVFFILYPPTRYEITEQYTFVASEKSRIALAVLVPKTLDYQQISNLKIEGGRKVVMKDTTFLQVVMVEPHEVKDPIIKITYSVYLPKGSIAWQGNTTISDISPQKGIESDNPELITKVKSITSGQTTEDARKIYNFVSTYIRWPGKARVNGTFTAMTTYKSKEGGCHDFAQLFTAMLRANGIPARSISGLALPMFVNFRNPTAWNHQAGAHAWVEFFADGRWHFADPSWGGSSHFDRLDGFHLSFGEEQAELQAFDMSKSQLISKFVSGNTPDSTYAIIGGMTNPLKFIAVASNNKAKVTPMGSVKINFGYRFLMLIFMILILFIIEQLIKRRIIFPDLNLKGLSQNK